MMHANTTRPDAAELTIPRAPRLPSDLAALTAADPMSLTLATLRGGQARVQAARDLGARLHLAALIADALAGR